MALISGKKWSFVPFLQWSNGRDGGVGGGIRRKLLGSSIGSDHGLSKRIFIEAVVVVN